MTFWQLAGACYTYRSYTTHGKLDPGLFLAAVSQYVYLVKFFVWEIGYMRSIDIIVDRAGFYETWGCIVWVPTVYTLHSRTCVTSPSQLSWMSAAGMQPPHCGNTTTDDLEKHGERVEFTFRPCIGSAPDIGHGRLQQNFATANRYRCCSCCCSCCHPLPATPNRYA